MGTYLKTTIAFLLALAWLGCHGGSKTAPVSEKESAAKDSLKSFPFAETPVFTVTSDMLAHQFDDDDVPRTVALDSATVWKTVYTIILDTLLCREGKNLDLATADTLLYSQYLQLRNDRILRVLYQKTVIDSVHISDSMVQAAYEAGKETFKVPDMYRARHLVINGQNMKKSADSSLYKGKSEAEMDSIARARVGGFRERILKGASFDTLAMMYSEDPNTAEKGGDLGYFETARMAPPFDSMVIHTPRGQISDVFKTPFGWHILKVEDYVPAHYQPLDSVRADLSNSLTEKAAAERGKRFVDSIRTAESVALDSAALLIPDSLHKPGDAMAVANPQDAKFGNDTIYFRDYIGSVYAYERQRHIDTMGVKNKDELLRLLAIRPALMQAARILGIPEDSSVRTLSEQTMDRYRTSILKKRTLNDGYKPTEAELRAYYDSHQSDYQVERPLKVQQIIFADSNLAEYVRDLLNSGADFMEMVDKYYPGDSEIKRAAADLGYIGPNDMPAAFYQTASTTPVGKTSSPVKTQYGYHLIKVLEKKYAVTFEDARYKIEPILIQRHDRERLLQAVESRLGGPPTIHWDKFGALYRLPPPPFQAPFIK